MYYNNYELLLQSIVLLSTIMYIIIKLYIYYIFLLNFFNIVATIKKKSGVATIKTWNDNNDFD